MKGFARDGESLAGATDTVYKTRYSRVMIYVSIIHAPLRFAGEVIHHG